MTGPNGAQEFLARMRIVTSGESFALGGPPPPEPSGTRGDATRATLASEAMRWSYVLRSRERWRDNVDVIERHQHEAAQTLHAFGLSDKHLRKIAATGKVVVQMPFESEKTGWAGRIFPWEYVLSRATFRYRTNNQRLTVMRHLEVAGASEPPPRNRFPKVLFVQSFPGALALAYEATEEADRVRGAFGLSVQHPRWRALVTPTLQELRKACAAFRPDIVHLTGCDNHQGLALLQNEAGGGAMVGLGDKVGRVDDWLRGKGVIDGFLMRRSDRTLEMCSPRELGRALTGGGAHVPFFVGLNFWNSGARVAPLLLAEGVLSGLGFQDVFDDALAEYLFENLYSQLMRLRWHLPGAFEEAWSATRRQVDLVPGTGVALWARKPLIAAVQGAKPVGVAPPGIKRVRAVPMGPATLMAQIKPKNEINYAELHNHGALFERFELRGPVTRPFRKALVIVELHCGPERARYEAEIELDEARLSLAGRVKVPLTATLMRSVSEAVISSLFVEIRCADQLVHKNTYALRLLPVDQWLDNAKSGQWLPSFVLPRDPAVARAITAAQRYVRVIRDDPSAGFEGYQSASADDAQSLENVDLQVEAIWSALLHEWQLGYINPPPTYSVALDSQRLRTPSSVFDARMGTCIDLALLFAACLELVDIHPVVFLLDGHALPGYWRHRDFQTGFRDMNVDATAQFEAGDEARSASPGAQRLPWRLGKVGYPEVWRNIRLGRLAPVETVRLTEHCGFREAREAGTEALKSAADFDSILDVAAAREHLVTPLPIMGERK